MICCIFITYNLNVLNLDLLDLKYSLIKPINLNFKSTLFMVLNQETGLSSLYLPHNQAYPTNTILLIEDKESYVDLILEALDNCNNNQVDCNLQVVKNGEEALNFLYRKENYAQAPRPELILLDLDLPKMNGFDFLSTIKENPELKLIPVVVLTTSSQPRDILESYKRHANCYITKPFELDQFFKTIQATVNFWFTSVKLPTP